MSPKKALVLGTILLVPVLAFLFLKMFGVNRYSLRTYFPTSVDSTLVEGQWRYDTVYHQIPDFSLTSQTGTSFSSKALEGKISIVHFFYTSCQGLCKQVPTQLARVQDAFRFQPEVKILSFTLHPEEDNLAAIQNFAKSYRADANRWIFLTGPLDQVSYLAQQGFFISNNDLSVNDPTQVPPNRLWLVDKEGHIRGMYEGSKATEIDKIITEVNVLLSEYELSDGK